MSTINQRSPVASVVVERIAGSQRESMHDEVSVEEPLEIRVAANRNAASKTIAVTMRTPGDDLDLAAGFLLTEGMVTCRNDIEEVELSNPNVVVATLCSGIATDAKRFDRHSFISSSCGVCGKRSIAAVRVSRRHAIPLGQPEIAPEAFYRLPETLREAQSGFARTGGLHASGLFDSEGRLLAVREDVGRHNALDKLIGSELLAGCAPLSNRILLVSGRVSFELVQKAAIAGIPVIGAVGAPSSLAVDLARAFGMTLIGFVRDRRFNIYSGASRIVPC